MTKLVGGRYEIIRKIAEGGMGAVFEARHHMTKKIVALKILFPHIGKNDASRQRFLREVSAPAQIGHDGIVDVTDSGFDSQDGSLFVAMEMLRGATLREWLEQGGHTRDDILDVFVRVLDPLAAAHANGIVHRDLKPENVFLHQKKNGSTVLKILDFGIARDLDTSQDNVTHTGIAMGTPHYMAPEQAMSAKGVLATADVWAIGVMMYEALSGKTPFDGETASAIVVHACTQPHPPIRSVVPDLDPAIAGLVDRCLDKTPQNRPRDAGELGQLLRAARPGRQVASEMTGGPTMSTPLTRDAALAQPSLTASNFGTAPPQMGMGGMPPGTPQHTAPQHTAPQHTAPQHTPPHAHPPTAQHTPPFGQPPTAQTPPAMTSPMHTPAPVMPATGGGGSKKGIWIAVAALGVLVVGGGVAAAVILGGDDGGTTTNGTDGIDGTTPGAPASASIVTPDGGGELFVDGVSQGPVASGAQIQLTAGPHTIELRVGGRHFSSQQVTAAGTPLTISLTAPTAPAGGHLQEGTLAAGDQTLDSGEFADRYTFQWTSGQTVRLDMRSDQFDTYLIVRAPSGAQQDNDDAAQGDTHAGLDVAVNETGTWTVICTSYQANETGAYQLITAPR